MATRHIKTQILQQFFGFCQPSAEPLLGFLEADDEVYFVPVEKTATPLRLLWSELGPEYI